MGYKSIQSTGQTYCPVSSDGRASDLHAGGPGFEPRLGLAEFVDISWYLAEPIAYFGTYINFVVIFKGFILKNEGKIGQL